MRLGKILCIQHRSAFFFIGCPYRTVVLCCLTYNKVEQCSSQNESYVNLLLRWENEYLLWQRPLMFSSMRCL